MKKKWLISTFLVCVYSSIFATEGMWIPSLIYMFYSDMQTYGLKLSPEEVYSTNQASLKDAIVSFNGTCTGSVISKEGLLLTNHHCGYDALQKLSTVDNNILEDGYWAKDNAKELSCPWLHVTFVREMLEVTTGVLEGVTNEMDKKTREATVKANIKQIEAKYQLKPGYRAKIKGFNEDNEYYMLITERFDDIRLVGVPPSSVGKFGGDTDNWVWPRHTGDFAIYRVYSNSDNEGVAFNQANKPYKPRYSLPVSLKDKKVGDFSMAYGFPAKTNQHLSSRKLQFYVEDERPKRIAMREACLGIIEPEMKQDAGMHLRYAVKQSKNAKYRKKWKGQLNGLVELHALQRRKDWEEVYKKRMSRMDSWKKRYGNVLEELHQNQEDGEKYELARALFIEYFFYGADILSFSNEFHTLIQRYDTLKVKGKLEGELKRLQEKAKFFFRDVDPQIDERIFMRLSKLYVKGVDEELLPADFKKHWKQHGQKIYKKSIFLNKEKLEELLGKLDKRGLKKLSKDPAYVQSRQLFDFYLDKVRPGYDIYRSKEQGLHKLYVEGVLKMFPDKKIWADANRTLRITYGKIEGSAPKDGMEYKHFTTLSGVLQKYNPDKEEFTLKPRFLEVAKAKDYGDYAQDGELWVCFTASNHTAGGNSGSPMIDADGCIMGVNFDRTWESTMSDFLFDESRCRNIAVDMRYILWVVDKYGGAKHLLDEMKLVK